MNINVSNPIIEDILQVSFSGNKENIIITDKNNKIRNVKVNSNKYLQLPLVIYKPNIYKGLEKELSDYIKRLDYYKKIGIENVEQFLCYMLFKKQRAIGRIKDVGKCVNDFINGNNDGFTILSQYIEYKLFKKLNKSKDYSIKTQYEKYKDVLKDYGVYSIRDYIKYNKTLADGIINYDKYNFNIDRNNYLEFELREFGWKREFFNLKGSLKNVQKFINKKYKEEEEAPFNILNIDIEYVKCPNYYYKNYDIKNIGEFISFQAKIKKITDRYCSLKNLNKTNLSKIEFIKQEIEKEKENN